MKVLEAEDIIQVLYDDKFESHRMFNNDKGQWVQFLMQSLQNKNVLIVGRVLENKLQNFAVVLHKSNITSMLYISDDVINDTEYKKEIFKWSKEFGNDCNVSNMKTWDGF